MACDLSKVTMRDIYTALGSPALLAMINRATAPGCLVEQAVNAALNQAFEDAEALLLARLGQVTLAMLNADLHERILARGGSHHLENVHYWVVNSTPAMAADSATAKTVAVVDRTPIALRALAKSMIRGVAVSRPI